MCGNCGDRSRWPCATKAGDPHMHICGCGHRWVAPLGSNPKCPGCTDEYGHSRGERQSMRMAKSIIEHYGLDAVMRQ
jgi:hypothetical protein